MEIGLHRSIRNCGNKYPNSTWAQVGHEIGPLRIYQCPKTFVTIEARAAIDAYDSSKHLNIPWFANMDEAPADFIDLCETIERERNQIGRGRDAVLTARKESHGKL